MAEASITLSEIALADLEAITALAAQLGYPEPVETFRTRFAKIAKDPAHKLWVAKIGDKIMGWTHVHRTAPAMITPDMAEVSALVVDEKARGTGVGKALLKQAEDWARAQGLKTVKLYSNIKRAHAHEFYARQGYEKRKLSGVFFKDLGQP
jgi:GNAT superfamily N-acetyltransferase